MNAIELRTGESLSASLHPARSVSQDSSRFLHSRNRVSLCPPFCLPMAT
jgi:hypothetical protein